jgi:hypothetical protein
LIAAPTCRRGGGFPPGDPGEYHMGVESDWQEDRELPHLEVASIREHPPVRVGGIE